MYEDCQFLVAPLSKEQIEIKAEQFLMQYQRGVFGGAMETNVETIMDVTLLGSHGVSVDIVTDDSIPGTTEAHLLPLKRKIQIPERTLAALARGEKRPRFTYAHEIAHVVLHIDQISERTFRLARDKRQSQDIPIYQNPEWQADYMAGCLLMPRRTLLPYIESLRMRGLSLPFIKIKISEVYGCSMESVEVRIKKLGYSI